MDKKLNDLLNIKKKSEASLEKKKNFTKLLLDEFDKNGINENTIKILDKGFSFEGARAVALYIDSLKNAEKSKMINLLFKTKIIKGNNKGIAFKILISLWAELLLISEVNNIEVIKVIISKLPESIKNKEGKCFGDAKITIKKYFVQKLSSKTKIININLLDLDNTIITNLRKIFLIANSDIDNLSKKEKAFIDSMLKSFDSIAETTITTDKKIFLQKKGETKEQSSQARLQKNDNNIVATGKKNKNKSKANKHLLLNLENEINKLQAKIEYCEKENICLQDNLHRKLKELEELKKNNTELLQKYLHVQKDLQKQIEILNIFEKNAQVSQKELLNSIASKLKCEYLDFKSAKNLPMTIDLGENLRDQINTIFQLLEKNGIMVKEKEKIKIKEIEKK